jgi:acetyl-CoA synthetase
VKGETACALIVLKGEYKPTDALKRELVNLIKKTLGPIVVISEIFFVDKLPKTRSGKIMRRLIKALITDAPLGDYSTIDDETAIEEVKKALKKT